MENKVRKRKNKMVILGIVGMILVFVGVRMATMETELEIVKTLLLPEFSKVPNIADEVGIKNEKWAVAMDGKIVMGGRGGEVQSTASTAKMITALAVMERKPFSAGERGEELTVSQEMYDRYKWYGARNGTRTAVEVGEKISQYEALEAILIASSNNMADALAEWAFGSLDEYREYATEMLRGFGLTRTVIGEDASGFDSSSVSTAEELAIIAEKVLEQPVLAEIVGKIRTEIPMEGEIRNTNLALGINGIIGVKTGWIGEISGYCLASGYLAGDQKVTMAILGAKTRSDSAIKTTNMAKRLQEEMPTIEVVGEGQEIGYYESWWTGKVPIVAEEKVEAIGWKGMETRAELKEGVLEIMIGGKEYKIPAKTEEFSREPSFFERLLHVFGWGLGDN